MGRTGIKALQSGDSPWTHSVNVRLGPDSEPEKGEKGRKWAPDVAQGANGLGNTEGRTRPTFGN